VTDPYYGGSARPLNGAEKKAGKRVRRDPAKEIEMKQRRKFNATSADAVRYYAVGLDEPNMLEQLQFAEGLPPEAVAEIRRDARETGSDVVVVGFSNQRAETVVLPPFAPCAVAFHTIAAKFGTRFDAGSVTVSPGLAAGIDAVARANSHPAPEAVQ